MSTHLTKPQLEELVSMLKAERARLYARGGMEVDVDNLPEPGDLQDLAKGEVSARDRLALSGRDHERLVEVEDALARVAAGSYGECEETGDPIPFARLQAEPTTRYTVEAQEMLEEERSRERVRGPADDDDAY